MACVAACRFVIAERRPAVWLMDEKNGTFCDQFMFALTSVDVVMQALSLAQASMLRTHCF
jgi:hypothetical protein